MKKRKYLIGLCMLTFCLLSGCKEVQIFESNKNPNEQIELTDKELISDTYYVKNGTKFISVYMPKGNAKAKTNNIKKDRVFYFVEQNGDEALVPEHYRSEVVAYASNEANLEEVTLERFQDLGYSIGLYGGTFKNDGYYHIDLEESQQVIGSTLLEALSSTSSPSIRIKAINGINVTEDTIDKSTGIFLNLERGKNYKISFFAGTYYYEADVVADTHFLQSYELYNYGTDHLSDTLNGYMSFETPEDLKSGWYNINGNGIFKYYDFAKGKEDLSQVDMNHNYYESEEEMIAACSSEYMFSVNEKSANLEIKITEGEDYSFKDISAYVYAPNNTRYNMIYDEEDKSIKAVVQDAIPGKWRINVLPKNVVVDNIEVNTVETVSELTLVEQIVTIEQEQENICICLDYMGEGTVNGTIITPSGETYIMEKQDTIKQQNGIFYTKMQYIFPYAEMGEYHVRIYHHPSETKIGEPYIEKDGGNSKDVIIITE